MKLGDGTEYGDGKENKMLLNASNNTWLVTGIMVIDLSVLMANMGPTECKLSVN